MGELLLFAGDRLSSSETPDNTFQANLIERLLNAPGLPLGCDRDMAHRVTAAVCADLVDHSQQARLRGDDYRSLVKLAEGVLEYDRESKRLFDGVYLPPPALSVGWSAHLRAWLDEIQKDQEETNRPGRPTDTWEPYLFASGLGLYAALYRRKPTTTGSEELGPGPTMRFMIELLAAGRTICEKYQQDIVPWCPRKIPTLKKQIKVCLDFEKSRPRWAPDPNDPETLFRPNSHVVYRDIYLARLRAHSPFPIHCWDDLRSRH